MAETYHEHFKLCDVCGKTDGYRNVGSAHWFYCTEHKRKWCVGTELISDWQRQSDAEVFKNWGLLKDFVEIHRPFEIMVVELFVNEFMRLQKQRSPGSDRDIVDMRRIDRLKQAAQILGVPTEFDSAVVKAVADLHYIRHDKISLLY